MNTSALLRSSIHATRVQNIFRKTFSRRRVQRTLGFTPTNFMLPLSLNSSYYIQVVCSNHWTIYNSKWKNHFDQMWTQTFMNRWEWKRNIEKFGHPKTDLEHSRKQQRERDTSLFFPLFAFHFKIKLSTNTFSFSPMPIVANALTNTSNKFESVSPVLRRPRQYMGYLIQMGFFSVSMAFACFRSQKKNGQCAFACGWH